MSIRETIQSGLRLFPGRMGAGMLAGILAFFCFSAWAAEFHLVVTGDLHGQAWALARLAPSIRAVGREAVRADIGDLEQGSFISSASGGLVMMDLLNALKFDFFVPGNHDFELGAEGFFRLCGAFDGRVLGADWGWRERRPIPWCMVTRNGVRAAVIGLTDPRMSRRILPVDDAEFTAPYRALTAIMPEIRAAEPEVVILLWHNGEYWPGGNLGRLLHEFPEIDLVVGGHTHEEQPGKRIGGRFFVQPGARGEAAAHIIVTVDDSTRKIISISSELIRPAAEAEPGLLKIITSHRPEDPEITKLDEPLRLPEPAEHNSAFGLLAARAMAEAAGCDAAIFYSSSRRLVSEKRLTEAGLYRLMPYRNRICVIEISREELRRFLEDRLEYVRNYPAALAGYGFTFTIDRRRKLDKFSAPERMTLALSDYLASGSEIIRQLARDPARGFRVLPEMTEREAVKKFLRKER